MAKMQFKMVETMFLIVWMQAIVAAVHLWRLGDHFTSGYILAASTVFCVLGVIALKLGISGTRKEGTN